MRRKALAVLLVLVVLAVVSGCAAYQAQHARADRAAAHDHHRKLPPSSLFAMKSSEEKLAQIHGEVEEAKQALAEEGKYACCVRPACNHCLLRFGACRCRQAIEGRGLGCGECMEGWMEGRGTVEGVNAEELLERQKQEMERWAAGAAEKEREGEKPPLRR